MERKHPRGRQEVEERLVAVTAELLTRRSANSISLREIAGEAGVNKGQIHHYFGGKRGLLEAAVRRLATEHQRSVSEPREGGYPRALSLAEHGEYYKALTRLLLDGDVELATLELREQLSVPQAALARLVEQHGDDPKLRARFAAILAIELGWAAFHAFALESSGLGERGRDAVEAQLRALINQIAP